MACSGSSAAAGGAVARDVAGLAAAVAGAIPAGATRHIGAITGDMARLVALEAGPDIPIRAIRTLLGHVAGCTTLVACRTITAAVQMIRYWREPAIATTTTIRVGAVGSNMSCTAAET